MYRFSEDEYDSDDQLMGPCADAQRKLLQRRKNVHAVSKEVSYVTSISSIHPILTTHDSSILYVSSGTS